MPESDDPGYAFLLDDNVYQLLTNYARLRIGRRSGQAGLEPESVVNSVIRGVIARDDILEAAKDERHLTAMLYTAIRWKVHDRLRDRIRTQNRSDKDVVTDVLNPGPLGNLTASESIPAFDRDGQRQSTVQRLLDACRNDRDQVLVECRLLADPPEPWSSIADRLRQKQGTLKTSMTGLKTRLLLALIDPMRTKVSGEDWMILKYTIAHRYPGSKAARLLGLPVDEIRERFEDVLFPKLVTELRVTGLALLWQLHGGMERSSKGRQD
ncbi:MAG: hypothetical protein AAGI68_01105 [Planctomycetota bacterium]